MADRNYFIQNSDGEYWTGSAWRDAVDTGSKLPTFARKFDLDEGLAIIEKRFKNGVRRPARRDGGARILRQPRLVSTVGGGGS